MGRIANRWNWDVEFYAPHDVEDIRQEVIDAGGEWSDAIAEAVAAVVTHGNGRIVLDSQDGTLSVTPECTGSFAYSYGGGDYVLEANARYFDTTYGDYASESFRGYCIELTWMPDDVLEALTEDLYRIGDYPVMDDDILTEVQQELQDELFERTVEDVLERLEDQGVTVSADDAGGALLAWMERESVYPDVEADYAYWSDWNGGDPTDELVSMFAAKA